MKRPRVRFPIRAWWGVGIAAFCLSLFGAVRLSNPREDRLVEWALRLPKERERARIAGFTGDKRVAPNFDPAKDAGVDWVRIEAIMQADAPEGKVPYSDEALRYANPATRAKAKRGKVRKLLETYRAVLPDAERASRKPLCYFPFRSGSADLDGAAAAELLAVLHLASAVEERARGRMRAAMDHAATGLRIARQLQAHNTIYPYTFGVAIESITLRVLREGCTGRDGAAPAAWARAFAGRESEFLRPPHDEPLPAARLRNLMRNDYLLMREVGRDLRARQYEPREHQFFELPPALRLVDRLETVLGFRAAADAWEASSDWTYAGMAVRLRGNDTEKRAYVLWKAIAGWQRHVAVVMKNTPELIIRQEWPEICRAPIRLEAERALAQAVWSQVSGGSTTKVPDDPFAPQPDTLLRRRDLSDGTTIWYSVGENGTDEGGDTAKDRIVRVPPISRSPSRGSGKSDKKQNSPETLPSASAS